MTFCTIVILANIVSAKMVPLPLGISFAIPAGLFFYPLTFLLSDLVTETFGKQKAQEMVYITLAMNALTFAILFIAIKLPFSGPGEQKAFELILGLSGLRIFSSLVAYFCSQLLDIKLYAFLKNKIGLRLLWLRANLSTLASQLADTVIIDLIFLYLGLKMKFSQVIFVMLFSFLYKMIFGVLTTPLLYGLVFAIRGRRIEGEQNGF